MSTRPNRHFPAGWDEERVRRVLSHYEKQTDEEAAAEDAAAFKGKGRTVRDFQNFNYPKSMVN